MGAANPKKRKSSAEDTPIEKRQKLERPFFLEHLEAECPIDPMFWAPRGDRLLTKFLRGCDFGAVLRSKMDEEDVTEILQIFVTNTTTSTRTGQIRRWLATA